MSNISLTAKPNGQILYSLIARGKDTVLVEFCIATGKFIFFYIKMVLNNIF